MYKKKNMFNIIYKFVFVELKVIIHRKFSKSGMLKKDVSHILMQNLFTN